MEKFFKFVPTCPSPSLRPRSRNVNFVGMNIRCCVDLKGITTPIFPNGICLLNLLEYIKIRNKVKGWITLKYLRYIGRIK